MHEGRWIKLSTVLSAALVLTFCGGTASCQQVSTSAAYVPFDGFSRLMRGLPKAVIQQLYNVYTGSTTTLDLSFMKPLSSAVTPNNSLADSTFRLGDVYAFPNPAKGRNPTIHIEVGVADTVDIWIYDPSGKLKSSVQLISQPAIVNRGTGPKYAYEYVWNVSGIGSDLYVCVVRAKKQGQSDIVARVKIAIIK